MSWVSLQHLENNLSKSSRASWNWYANYALLHFHQLLKMFLSWCHHLWFVGSSSSASEYSLSWSKHFQSYHRNFISSYGHKIWYVDLGFPQNRTHNFSWRQAFASSNPGFLKSEENVKHHLHWQKILNTFFTIFYCLIACVDLSFFLDIM